MSNDDVRDVITVILSRDPDDERVDAAAGRLGTKQVSIVVSAAFALAVNQRFRGRTDLAEVRDFVTGLRRRLDSADDVPQLYTEALVRAALGEEELLDDVPADLVVPLQTLVTYAVVDELRPDDAGRQAFVDEAAGLARDWLADV